MRDLFYKILISACLILVVWIALPIKESLRNAPFSFVLFDKDHYLLGARIASDQQWRFPELDSVPYKFEKAITLFEDEDFYNHPGIDCKAVARAIYQNYKSGEIKSGASTITMQLMRLNFPKAKRSYSQKIKESVLAFKKEFHSSKKQILKEYCSHAPFGGNVVGLETASWRYFRKSPNQLSWAETAMLAVLPNAPALIHPGRNRDILKKKRDRLLRKLNEKGWIDAVELKLSLLEEISPRPDPLENLAPHFLSRVKNKSKEFKFYSTLDVQIQKESIEILNANAQANREKEILNAAAIIIDNRTKKVLAYVGNTDGHEAENYNDMIMAPRSSGSILKPLLYGLALQDGMIAPKQLAPDVPMSFNGYSPKNFNKKFHGAIPYDQVISKSLNVPSVDLLSAYNHQRFLEDLKSMGLGTLDKSADHYGLSLILGGGEVRLWDIANVYASLASVLNIYLGKSSRYPISVFESPIMEWGKSKTQKMTHVNPKLAAGSIYAMFKAMEKLQRPDRYGSWKQFSSSGSVYWKTGTSFGFKDAWAVGVTPDYTVATWVGNSSGEGRPDILGVKVAGVLMFDIFGILGTGKEFDIPYDDMVEKSICAHSGHLAGKNCSDQELQFIPKSSAGSKVCPYHKKAQVHKINERLVFRDCCPSEFINDTTLFILPPDWAMYYKINNPTYVDPPEIDNNCLDYSNQSMALDFIYPDRNLELVIPKNLAGQRERCVLKANHSQTTSTIFWHVNDTYHAKTNEIHEISLSFAEGEHVVSIQDENGNTVSRKISVRLGS